MALAHLSSARALSLPLRYVPVTLVQSTSIMQCHFISHTNKPLTEVLSSIATLRAAKLHARAARQAARVALALALADFGLYPHSLSSAALMQSVLRSCPFTRVCVNEADVTAITAGAWTASRGTTPVKQPARLAYHARVPLPEAPSPSHDCSMLRGYE